MNQNKKLKMHLNALLGDLTEFRNLQQFTPERQLLLFMLSPGVPDDLRDQLVSLHRRFVNPTGALPLDYVMETIRTLSSDFDEFALTLYSVLKSDLKLYKD